MEPFTQLTARAAPLAEANIDTDIILPARFLVLTHKRGLGQYAFFERRAQGGFVLDDPRYAGAQILVAGANFGCGSSREHAPWALQDLGIRCVIAPSFGEIFRANCVRNGMLPVVLPEAQWRLVLAAAEAGQTVTANLFAQTITLAGQVIPFAIDAAERATLLGGLDEIGGLLGQYAGAIAQFETSQRAAAPWLWEKERTNG